MIDFHSHILPQMDDGSNDVNESLQMLKLSYNMGIDTMISTSHYYVEHESIDAFLKKREEAYRLLMSNINGADALPNILLGAEVAFFTGISREKDISRLCIENTNCLLLEMPFCCWSSLIIKEVQGLTTRGITPIIAHIEKFFPYQHKANRIDELLNLDVLVQANAESIIQKECRRLVLKMIRNGTVHLLGSDCHNMLDRPPNLEYACKMIEKKLGSRFLKEMDHNGRRCLQSDARRVPSTLSPV